MATLCKELKSLSPAACKNPMQIAKRLVFFPEIGSDETQNHIPSDELTKTDIKVLIDNVDPLDRLYVTPILENVENARAETTFHEFNSGLKLAVRQGVKRFVGYIPLEYPQMLGAFKAWEGQRFGAYVIDKDGNFIFQADPKDATKYMPFQIDGNSFVATYVEPTDAEVAMVKVEFDYSASVKDELIRFVPERNIDFNALGSDLYALKAASITNIVEPTVGSNTKLTFNILTDYGVPVTGLTKTDFTSAVTLTTEPGYFVVGSVIESAGGRYELTLTSAKAGTGYIAMATKSGFDFTGIKSVPIAFLAIT